MLDDGKLLGLIQDLLLNFGIIKRSELKELLGAPDERAEQLIRLLLTDQAIFEIEGGKYLSCSPRAIPDPRVDIAIGCAAKFRAHIDPQMISAVLEQCHILTFIYQNKMFEVIVLLGDEKLYQRLEPDMGYVIAIDDLEKVKQIDIGLCENVYFALISDAASIRLFEVSKNA